MHQMAGLWLASNLVEVPLATVRLATVYALYTRSCESVNYPICRIQTISRIFSTLQPTHWPSAKKKRVSKGTLFVNITLRAWVTPPATTPTKAVDPPPGNAPGAVPEIENTGGRPFPLPPAYQPSKGG